MLLAGTYSLCGFRTTTETSYASHLQTTGLCHVTSEGRVSWSEKFKKLLRNTIFKIKEQKL